MAEVANPTDSKSPDMPGADTTNVSPSKFDEKLNEQDKILEEAKNDQDQKVETDDLYDEHGNFDEFGAKVRNSYSFKHKDESLHCHGLNGNPTFNRLRSRIMKFHVEAEKYRKFGST